MADYQLLPADSMGGVMRTADGAFVPDDPSNGDWQIYQTWLAAGNTPDPAPVIPPSTVIPPQELWGRFTSTEQAAIETAIVSNPDINRAIIFTIIQGEANLVGPIVTSWMAALVSAGAITSDRSDVILTP